MKINNKRYNYNGLKLISTRIVRKKCLYFSAPEDIYYKAACKVITNQLRNPNPIVVPVYQFGNIQNEFGEMSYFYDMAKCQPLTKAETNFVNNEWGWDIVRPGRFKGMKKLAKFLKEVTKLKYHDLHAGNVMKYKGNYVLIDLEGF